MYILYEFIYFFYTSVECTELPENIENGKVAVINKRKVTFVCDEGYILSTKIHTFTCKNDGTWNLNDIVPRCIKSSNCFFFYFYVKILFVKMNFCYLLLYHDHYCNNLYKQENTVNYIIYQNFQVNFNY